MSTFPNDVDPFALEQPAPTENQRLMAGLAYASQVLLPAVLPVVLLLSEEQKRSAFVRRHAVQALGLFAAALIYEMAAGAVLLVFGLLVPCLLGLLWVLPFLPVVPFLYYGYRAYQGEAVEIPWLTGFLRDNKWL